MPHYDRRTSLAFAIDRALRARACETGRTPAGVVYRRLDMPVVYDLNVLECAPRTDAQAAEEALEAAFGDSSVRHRRLFVDDPATAAALAPELERRGYTLERLVGMRRGVRGLPDPPPGVTLDALRGEAARDLRRELWRTDMPELDERAREQLVRTADVWARVASAFTVAARGDDGAPAAQAIVYVDDELEAAIIDHVETLPAQRGRGLARAVIARSIAYAGRLGCDEVTLIADAGDWPADWYRRLGFEEDGERVQFTRA